MVTATSTPPIAARATARGRDTDRANRRARGKATARTSSPQDSPQGEGPPEPKHPTVAAAVRERLGASWSRARKLCTDGRVTVNGERCLDPTTRIAPDALLVVDEHAPKHRPGPLSESAIVFFDSDVVVVDKPAGMLSVADEEGNIDTLLNHARTVVRRMDKRGKDSALGVVHRLDRETSGVMVFARTASAHRSLAEQFRAREMDRMYEAIVHGAVTARHIETQLVPDRGDGLRGSFGLFRRPRGAAPSDAKRAVTNITVIETLRGATLVECRLETGRQHQVRIHLSELGHPLLGERVYIRDYKATPIEAPRLMLHAR